MSRSTYASLMDAIQSNDPRQFLSILQTDGLPEGLWWLDYDLLTRALQLNRRQIVGYLLDNGCCVRKPCDKTSPLHVAAAKSADWRDVVEKLLRLGARVSARDASGDTAVHVAFKNRAPTDVLDALLQSYLHETSVSVSNNDGLTVLHIACTRPRLEFVERFQYHRSSIDSQVSLNSNSINAGYTPLHFAVEHGRHEIVMYLLERGADLYLQDRSGSTPLHLALERCDVMMINLICQYVTKFDDITNIRGLSHFMAACASNDPSLVEKYLGVGSVESLIDKRVEDIDDHPFAGYTPLHFAAVHDRVHIARLLLHCRGEELFWAASARNHTASSLAFESKCYRMAKLFSAYCEGGDAWTREVEKIERDSAVRKIATEVELERDRSFASCCDVDVSEKNVTESECLVDEEVRLEEECDVVGENLDDTPPVDDDDREDELICRDACAEQTADRETSIRVTPRSTRSLRGKSQQVFATRVRHMHAMSRRLFLDADRDEDEPSDGAKVRGLLSALTYTPILVGTLFLLSVSAFVSAM